MTFRQNVPVWQPWLALGLAGLLLQFTWEMLQSPLYRHIGAATRWAAVQQCAQGALGDVVILWLAYALASAGMRDTRWLLAERRGAAMAVFLLAGVLTTVALEWVNVYARPRWAYTPAMPLLFGIGLAPLLQWVVVPPLALWLARRHLDSVAR